jgi:hypothetical protein
LNSQVIVLCYHRFEDKPKDSLAIKPADFEAQMQALKDSGITVISMEDFLAWRRGEKGIPEKAAIISIDDGYLLRQTTDQSMDLHTESGWKQDPTTPEDCEMNFRNNLTAFSWKAAAPGGTRLRSGAPLARGVIVDSRVPQVTGRALGA